MYYIKKICIFYLLVFYKQYSDVSNHTETYFLFNREYWYSLCKFRCKNIMIWNRLLNIVNFYRKIVFDKNIYKIICESKN